MIDAGYDNVRVFLQESRQCEVHTIRWRTIDEVAIVFHLVDPERRMQSQGIACAAVVAIRRDDDDIGDFRQSGRQRIDTCGKVAVVVADKDFH